MADLIEPATVALVADDVGRRTAWSAVLTPLWRIEEMTTAQLGAGLSGQSHIQLVVIHLPSRSDARARMVEKALALGPTVLLISDSPPTPSIGRGVACLVNPGPLTLIAAVASLLARANERRVSMPYESFFARSSELFFISDAEGKLWRVNPALERALGAAAADLEGASLSEFVHPDDRQATASELRVAIASGQAARIENRLRTRGGDVRHYTWTLTPIQDQRLVYACGRDNTDRRLQEERFRLLASATSDALWERDLETGRTWSSEGLRTQFGWTAEELTLDMWRSCVHRDDQARVQAALQKSHHGEGEVSSWSVEYRFRRKDGRYARVLDHGFVVRDSKGRPVQLCGSLSDVTERRHSERLIREQAALLDKARDAILVRDMDGRITYWNNAAERMYGFSAAEAAGQNAGQLITKDPSQLQRGEAVLLRQGEWSGELTQKTKDGRELLVEARWTLVRDEDGHPRSIFAIDTDITERKKLESQFLRIQRMESIGTLAGGIAHDLNNILTPILISTEFLHEACEGNSEAEEALAAIDSSSRRAADMVQQILLFARGVDGQRLPVRPGPLVLAIAKIARETFGKAIRVSAEADETPCTISGDPTQLHQVLLNLCVNARDAMPDGGELSVSSSTAMVDDSYAALNPDARPGRYVVLKVSDNGAGISPDLREKIFEPFFTTKEVGRGTGLGLSTALAIVRSHGGFINVYSEPGRGSTFKVYLPAAEDTRAEETSRLKAPELPRGSGELVLVVDDESAIRAIAKKTLESFGYRVLTADNGAAAVATYARHQGEISVVLTDMAMPIMDGAAMIHALKNLDPTVRIVAASGLGTNGSMAKALSAGVKTFLQKPYTADLMLTTLRDVLRTAAI